MSDPAHPFLDQTIARRLLDDSTVLFAALEGDGTIAWMSDSSSYLLGTPAAEQVGTNMLDLLHPDDQELVIETMGEPARGAEDRIRVALRLRHAHGTWISLEFGGIDLRSADGSGLFLVWGSPNEATGRLLQFLNALLAGADLHDLLDQVVTWHDATTPGTRSIVLLRSSDGAYRCRAASETLPADLRIDLPATGRPTGPWDLAIGDGRPHSWTEVAALAPTIADAADRASVQAVWVMPVAGPGDRHPLALVVLWRQRPGPMLATQRRQLEQTAQVIRLAVQWSVNQRALVVAATTDPLTGLANRSQLDAAIRGDRSALAAVLFIDLDDFKRVNDRHGHLVGDQILRESADRMAEVVRADDLLVRLGGDEFAVWCPGLRSPTDAESVADRIVAALRRPIEVDGVAHDVGASIGLAMVTEGHASVGDVDRLLGAADQALYRAKDLGKDRWVAAGAADEPLPFPD